MLVENDVKVVSEVIVVNSVPVATEIQDDIFGVENRQLTRS